ncbi:2-phospho-L-lactate guanylyltransferase [Sphingobium sp. AN641]|uniref:2-phospho-L-lactate guanylyltransferase n=1 Tax=Sphingobium sp. AN641 TaxID=3133443 RepID=UPI0030BEB1C7
MTQWTALVPMKQGADTKSRLAGAIDLPARVALAHAMVAHVLDCLRDVEAIGDVHLLAPAPEAGLDTAWLADGGAGLNAELARAHATIKGPLLIIHADLPHLTPADVSALLAAARDAGAAIAPDRHGRGTNALALTGDPPVAFAFGEDSFARHMRLLPDAAIVRRPGLARDLDTAEDLAEARRAGVVAAGAREDDTRS